MDSATLILLLLLVSVIIAIVLFVAKKRTASDSQGFLLIQNQINEMQRAMDERLAESSRAIQSHFGVSTKIIEQVTEKLVKLDETNKQVVNFADELRKLQDVLKNPKQRGILGEYYLENLLKNILPPGGFTMQYAFADGIIADAVIFIKDKIIPIDAKFPLENYNRLLASNNPTEKERFEKQFRNDLKERINETAKYVRPEYGTMDFAFMFIPAEAIYYDLLTNRVGTLEINMEDLIQYAFRDKHVIIVAPTSFLAYLQTVLQGLKALAIEESAKEIQQRVAELGRHLASYDVYMKKLGNHLDTAVSMYNNAYKEFDKVDKDVLRISGTDIKI
jgi:DNA recombination protein RmuC